MLTLASGRPADGIAAGIGLSAAVEAVQALIPQLGRSCEPHDLVAKSLGAIAGVGLAATVQLVLRPVSGPRTLTSPVYVVEQNAVLAVSQAAGEASGRAGTRDGEEPGPPPNGGQSPMRGCGWFSTGCG